MRYQCLEGQIIHIEEQYLVKCNLKFSNHNIFLKLQNTPIVHGRGFDLLQPNNLKAGQYFQAYVQNQNFESGKVSLEYHPSLFVVNEEEKFFAVTIGQYNEKTNLLADQLLTRIDENTVIRSSTGLLKYKDGIFRNCECAAFYKIRTLSIPPKATPQLWVIL